MKGKYGRTRKGRQEMEDKSKRHMKTKIQQK